jgi:beta-galactosidase
MRSFLSRLLLPVVALLLLQNKTAAQEYRDRESINTGWKFMRYDSGADKLVYDVRPAVSDRNDNKVADSKPTESVTVNSSQEVLKKWILPTANDFIKDPAKWKALG